ncbi:MAG TPA: hypothetical protein PLJ98_00125 [Acholeplasmataceae bacterium]|jgi:hypothetical protein|nr:hypothetical protein [Bacteroidales bacterium]HPG42198.1 hypothetical protein [Acholeplasmataceae bacterium]HRX44451.1 hypothetical protein [Acholeplasmataceae bacterium]
MLSYDEKKKIKEILSDGLNIRKDINFPFYLDAISESNEKIKNIESSINTIIYNQRVLDEKMNKLIWLLEHK